MHNPDCTGQAGDMTREKRVLVVDDDDAIRSLVTTVLRRRGLIADTARNGVEAVEAFAARRHHVILLDLMMPTMNGWEVLDHLEALPARERPLVIVLTAGSEPRAFKPDLVAGMVRKPFDIDMLVDSVVGCMASLEAHRAGRPASRSGTASRRAPARRAQLTPPAVILTTNGVHSPFRHEGRRKPEIDAERMLSLCRRHDLERNVLAPRLAEEAA